MDGTSLRSIVLECISLKLNEMEFARNPSDFIDGVTLYEYARARGYRGTVADLFNFANSMDISNENGEFEERAITPVKRAQRIHY